MTKQKIVALVVVKFILVRLKINVKGNFLTRIASYLLLAHRCQGEGWLFRGRI